MRDLDSGPHRRCNVCNKLTPEKRSIEFNDKWFCSLPCKLKQERKDDESLHNRSNLLTFNPRTG